MDIGRKADLEYIAKRLPQARGSERDALLKSAYNILNESGFTRSMRESLIREKRQGRSQNVKDIHEYVQAKRDSGNVNYI